MVKIAPTPQEFLSVPEEQVKNILSVLGLQNKKYELIRDIVIVLSRNGPKVQVQDLEKIRGLGKFGKAVFEVFVLKKCSALIDEVVGRAFSRALGLRIKGKAVNYERLWTIMEVVAESLTVEELKALFYGTVDLGRKICKVKEPACSLCPLIKLCEYALESQSWTF